MAKESKREQEIRRLKETCAEAYTEQVKLMQAKVGTTDPRAKARYEKEHAAALKRHNAALARLKKLGVKL